MSFEYFLNKEYIMPLNIPDKHTHKYIEVLEKGYSKYLDIISSCGNVIMLDQFVEIVARYHPIKYRTHRSYTRITEPIIQRLSELGFVETGILGKYKYIYLKHPSLAIVHGDYKTHYRTGGKNTVKMSNILFSNNKAQALIEHNIIYDYFIMHKQLMDITIEIYDLIIKSENKYRYDIEGIKTIIELGTYEKIRAYLKNDDTYGAGLGVIRTLWEDLGKGYASLGKKRQTINHVPFYKKINIQDDGLITLHYIPEIIIYDIMENQHYYDAQSNALFKIFFNLKDNSTDNLKNDHLKCKNLGPSHLNRIGYVVKIIGSNRQVLKDSTSIIDIPYYDNKYTHTPIVKNSTSVFLNTKDYFTYANTPKSKNDVFNDIDSNIDTLIIAQKED